MDFREKIIVLLQKERGLKKEELENLVVVPPDPKLGDYAFPCFVLGGNPHEEAEKLKAKIKLPRFIANVEVVGPYLNFFVKEEVLAEETLKEIFQEKKSYGKGKEKKNMVVEYCGPNTNKPLHLGHVRNMALGDSLCRILSFLGHKVHPVNIVNDRGIHICQSMLAYQKWGNNKHPDKKSDHFVGDYYVLFSQKAKDEEERKESKLKEEVHQMLLKWEQKDPEVRKLWKKMNGWVLEGFKETYNRFGIKFEKEYFESEMYEKAKKMVQEGMKKKVFVKNPEGAVLVELGKFNLPDKVVLRADGTSIYITQDMYLAEERYRDFKYDQLIYVVASEQNLHFKQLFKILELLKRPYAKHLYHLSYGLVNLPSGRMKSREGTVVDADDFMDEVAGLAEKEVEKRHPNLAKAEIKKRAEMISLGAIKFFMLRTDPVRDMVFNPEESLSFEGETGPYVQYAHARACSILRKAPVKISSQVDFKLLNSAEESFVVQKLSAFPEILLQVVQNYKPHHLAQHLISLSQGFNEFYHKSLVISEDKELMKARLLLVDSVRQVLENGLGLLGIKAPEEM